MLSLRSHRAPVVRCGLSVMGLALGFAVTARVAVAQVGPEPVEPRDGIDCLPQAVSPEMFEELRTRSPFLRTLNFEDTYRLRGIARIDGDQVALVYNRETEQTVRVSSKAPNAEGMQLVGVDDRGDLAEAKVTLSFAGEEVTLNYSESQVQPQPGSRGGGGRGDSSGRQPLPRSLIEKYRTMNPEQQARYQRWKQEYLRKNPDSEHSQERYELGERVIDAIKSGRDPDRVR